MLNRMKRDLDDMKTLLSNQEFYLNMAEKVVENDPNNESARKVRDKLQANVTDMRKGVSDMEERIKGLEK